MPVKFHIGTFLGVVETESAQIVSPELHNSVAKAKTIADLINNEETRQDLPLPLLVTRRQAQSIRGVLMSVRDRLKDSRAWNSSDEHDWQNLNAQLTEILRILK